MAYALSLIPFLCVLMWFIYVLFVWIIIYACFLCSCACILKTLRRSIRNWMDIIWKATRVRSHTHTHTQNDYWGLGIIKLFYFFLPIIMISLNSLNFTYNPQEMYLLFSMHCLLFSWFRGKVWHQRTYEYKYTMMPLWWLSCQLLTIFNMLVYTCNMLVMHTIRWPAMLERTFFIWLSSNYMPC